MAARYRLFDIGWVLATNLLVLAGVIAWGWPPGNVFLLFWIENAVLGAVTAVRIATAQGPAAQPPGPKSILRFPRWGRVAFFVVHYGIFAAVHLVFVGPIAVGAGVSWSFWALGLPAVLIGLRYAVDLAGGWFAGRQRFETDAEQAFWSPYPRLIVLHVATLLGFALAMPPGGAGQASWLAALAPVRAWFDALGYPISDGAVLVALLMMLKTIADLAMIRGAAPRGLQVSMDLGL